MRFSLVALFVLATATLAHADTIQNFNLTGTFANGTVAGTVTVNTTSGAVLGENVTYTTTNNGSYVFNETNPLTGVIGSTNPNFFYIDFQNGVTSAYLEFNLTSLVNYKGGSVCTLAAPCPGNNASNIFQAGNYTPNLQTATLTPVSAATPEPSSLVLLGTGAFGLIGAARRRFFKA